MGDYIKSLIALATKDRVVAIFLLCVTLMIFFTIMTVISAGISHNFVQIQRAR